MKEPARTITRSLACVLAAGTAVLGVGGASAADKPFKGVDVNVLTFTGPQIAEPLQRRAPDFSS